jgi:hypothetical protein
MAVTALGRDSCVKIELDDQGRARDNFGGQADRGLAQLRAPRRPRPSFAANAYDLTVSLLQARLIELHLPIKVKVGTLG